MDIKVYMRTTEPYSQTLVAFLRARGIVYSAVDVSIDRSALKEMINKSGQKRVPVIDVGGKILVGFNRPQLEKLLEGDLNAV